MSIDTITMEGDFKEEDKMILYAMAETKEDALNDCIPTFVNREAAIEMAERINYGVYQIEIHNGQKKVLEVVREPIAPEDNNFEITLERAMLAVDRLNDEMWYDDHKSLAQYAYEIAPNHFLWSLVVISKHEYYIQLINITVWDTENDTRAYVNEASDSEEREPLEYTLLRESSAIFKHLHALSDTFRVNEHRLKQLYAPASPD